MKALRLYRIARWTGYLSGISGLVLVLAARRSGEPGGWMFSLGGTLLGVMFVSLIFSHLLFTILQFRRRSGGTPAAKRMKEK